MTKVYFLPIFLLHLTALSATPAPDFSVTTSDGQTRQLYQDYVNQQKVMVLEIFFTTCPPCATHAPFLQTLYTDMTAAYPGQVEFMLLSDKNADTNPVVAAYLSSKGLTMPAAGSDGGSLTAVQPYKNGNFGLFEGTPTFVVIAPGTGEVFFNIQGNSPQETMALIAQKIGELLPQTQDCFLKSYFDNPLDSVHISVEASNGFTTEFIASGSYSLSDIPELQNVGYGIVPFKDSDPLQGLSTYDLVLIVKHILGLQPFSSPWQMIAADMNCSASVTTFDVVEGRKVILGITNGFAGCGGLSWKFVADPPGAPANGSCLNFRGVKIGDITGSYFAPDDGADDRNRITLMCNNRRLEAGQTMRLQFEAGADITLSGLQFSLGVDPALISIEHATSAALPGFNQECFNLDKQRSAGFVPFSWVAGGAAAEIRRDEPLFELEIRALQDVSLDDAIGLDGQLQAELYGNSGEIVPFDIEWRTTAAVAQTSVSITPNPAGEVFFMELDAAQGGDVLLQMLDNQGKTVLKRTIAVAKGANRIELRPDAIKPGLYYLKLDGSAAGKIVLNK